MPDQAQNLGAKFTCFKCECKFYDLGAPEPLCPRCGADQREAPAPEPVASSRRRSKPRAKKRVVPAIVTPKPAAPVEEGEDLLDDDFDESAPAADDSKAKGKAKGKAKAKSKAKDDGDKSK